MAQVEKLREELKNSEFAGGQEVLADGKTVSVSFLETFLQRLKLFALMKQENPKFSLSEEELRTLDSQLDSSDHEVRKGAFARIEELIGLRESAQEKLPNMTTVGLVDMTKLGDNLRQRAEQVDAVLQRAHADLSSVSERDLEETFASIQEIRTGLGERGLGVGVERAAGFEYLEKQLYLLKHRREVKKFQIAGGEFRSDPARLNRDDFRDEPGNDDLLRIRDNRRPAAADELKAFKTRVRTELIEDGSKDVLASLSGNELLQRIQEVSGWQSRMRELYGDAWQGRARLDDTRHLLFAVENKYRDALIAKLQAEVATRNVSIGKEHVASATRKVLETEFRVFGTSRYAFDPEKGYEQVAGRVAKEGKDLARKYQEVLPKKTKQTSPEFGELLGEPDDEIDYRPGLEELAKKKRLDSTVEELNTLLLGSDYEMSADFWQGMDEEGWVERTAASMRAEGVHNPRLEAILENVQGLFNQDGEARDVAKNLGKLLKEESYSEAINYIMEYISRVGLREASQDWKLAVLLRQQKDIISRINPDAAEAFEGRQHLRFLPSMSALPPDKYGEIGAQVTAKSPIDLILNPNNASMFAIQAEVGGRKLNVSTAMFLDMLRSSEFSMRLLNADINSIDSTLDSILIERLWGKGAKKTADGFIQLGSGQKIALSEKVAIDYFDIMPKSPRFGKTMGKPQEVTIEDLLNRGHWMLQDAQQVWWYSRIWEKHLANYPKEQMQQGPKKIASVGRMWGAYNAEYEKYARTMWEVAEIGSGLPPHEAYKAADMIGRNVIDTLMAKYEKENPERWNNDKAYREQMVKKATKVGKFFERVLCNRASFDVEGEKLEFVLDTLSLEEARLLGNTIDTSRVENILPYVRQRMLASGFKEREIPSDAELLNYANSWKNTKNRANLDPKKDQNIRFWGAQIEEVGKWIDLRKFNMNDAVIKDGLEAIELSDLMPFLQNEALVHGEARTVTSVEEFFRGFEFSSVVNWAKTNHADDPFQYGTNYYQKSLEAGTLLNNVCNLTATREERYKLYETMQAYVAGPELRKFIALTENRFHRSRTNQVAPYEVVQQAWTMGADGKKHYSDSPNTYDFITMIDSEGKKWQVRTATGGRATMKTEYIGNFGWREKGQYGERDSDVESDMRYWNAKGFITKHKSEEMYEQVTGIHREVKWLFDRMGWHGATAKKVEHFVSHWGSKVKTILKKHPIFDDPWWAFWKILDEYKEFAGEVGKEMVKEVAH